MQICLFGICTRVLIENCDMRFMFLQFDVLELDRFVKPLVSCPLLLDSANYFPDTVDLTQDQSAREYWLHYFEDSSEKVRACFFIYLLYLDTNGCFVYSVRFLLDRPCIDL